MDQEDFESQIIQSKETATFEEITFTGINFPKKINKNIIFKECQFEGPLVIKEIDFQGSLSFDECHFTEQVGVSESIIMGVLRFSNCSFERGKYVMLLKVSGNKFRLEICQNGGRPPDVKIIDQTFPQGVIINLQGSFCEIFMRRVIIDDVSYINLGGRANNRMDFADVQFLAWTELSFHSRIRPRSRTQTGTIVSLENCALDNLYIEGLYYNDTQINIDTPYLAQRPIKALRKFTNILSNRMDSYASFVRFARLSQAYFAKTPYKDLEEYYYLASKFFSRHLADMSRTEKIANNLFRLIAFYGYSVWRPICCLLVLFVCFSTIFLMLDVFYYKIEQFSASTALLEHLERLIGSEQSSISFGAQFELNRLLIVIERVLLVPAFVAALTIGIKKLLRRS